MDMLCHWRYVLDDLFGPVQAVSCLGATHIPGAGMKAAVRMTPPRKMQPTRPSSWKAALWRTSTHHGVCECGETICSRSKWRERKDPRWPGCGIAGFNPPTDTPRPVWNPDVAKPHNYFDDWQLVSADERFDNAFKSQWELFLRHVVAGEPFRWNLLEGAKGVQLAEKGLESWRKRAWVDVPALEENTST